jgi:DNA-binding transcriptional MerR regulator
VELIKVREAAKRLNVSPSTLRAWEERFGFPLPERSPGGHRLYRAGEVAALRDALEQELSIASAVARVRQGHVTDANALAAPLAAFDADRAAAAAEGALVLRSLERMVEEVLLPALDSIHERHGRDGATWAFAAQWGEEWLRWARRLALQSAGAQRLLLGDATAGGRDPDRLRLHALDLFCTRAGMRVRTLPVGATGGLASATAQFAPDVIAVAGDGASDDEVARWVYSARAGAGARNVALFHRDARVRRPAGVDVLDPSPLAAYRQVLALARGAHAVGDAPARSSSGHPA